MRLVVLISTLLFYSGAAASPAGVIAYACIEDGPYVLLAFDPNTNRMGYGVFGGGKKADESIAETAAREFHEETRCIFDTPTAVQLAATRPSERDGYYSFVAQVPFVSPSAIPQNPCEARLERSDWLWVRYTDLISALESDQSRPKVRASLDLKYITLWEGAASALRAAIRDGLLAKQRLCQ
jgi:ADP-ribose pyrophosphatase YjhB (NUDIX family)